MSAKQWFLAAKKRDLKFSALIAFFVVAALVVAGGLLWDSNRTADAVAATTPFTPTRESLAPEVQPITNKKIADVIPRLTDPDHAFTVVVLGDSTGAARRGWVVQTAEALARKSGRATKLHQWSVEANPQGYLAPWSIAEGTTPAVTVWNGSASGKNFAYTNEHWAELIPIPGDTVDLVIVNHGHNEAGGTLAASAISTMQRAKAQFPNAAIVATLQNPERPGSKHADEQAANIATLRENVLNLGGEVIDVNAAYLATAGWENKFDSGDLHPDQSGYDLWTTVVRDALGI